METGKRLDLTTEDRERIRQAVEAAERRTNAEIVPMIVTRSGLYRDAQHRAGLTLAVLVLSVLLTIELEWVPWGWHASNAAWLVLSLAAAYGLGLWAGTLAPVIRFFTSTERMRHKVRLRAERAFSQHAISQTRERTGVLIMLSLLERQVCILADRTIHERAPQGSWETVVQATVERIKANDFAGGLCRGIEECGTLLARSWPAGSGENPNELPDKLIQEP